jgi:hypothetical protein
MKASILAEIRYKSRELYLEQGFVKFIGPFTVSIIFFWLTTRILNEIFLRILNEMEVKFGQYLHPLQF